MFAHRRNVSAFSNKRSVCNKNLTVSPVSRISNRISINNTQLPKFLQIDSKEIASILTKDHIEIKVKIPITSPRKQILKQAHN